MCRMMSSNVIYCDENELKQTVNENYNQNEILF